MNNTQNFMNENKTKQSKSNLKYFIIFKRNTRKICQRSDLYLFCFLDNFKQKLKQKYYYLINTKPYQNYMKT